MLARRCRSRWRCERRSRRSCACNGREFTTTCPVDSVARRARPTSTPTTPTISHPRTLEDDRLVRAALPTKARKPDLAAGLTRRRIALQSPPERLQPSLIGAGHHFAAPRRELVLDRVAAERHAQALIGPRHIDLQASRTLVQAPLDQRQALVEPEPRGTHAPSKELLLLGRRVKRETERLMNHRTSPTTREHTFEPGQNRGISAH